MPGGMGTVQELFTLLLLKHENDPLMDNADIVICNEQGFWEPLIALIDAYGFHEHVHVVDTIAEVAPKLDALRKGHTDRQTIDQPVADDGELVLPAGFAGGSSFNEAPEPL